MKDNYGYGSFSDQYDNNRVRSVDRDQNVGGVTGFSFEDDFDIETNDYFPDHGSARSGRGLRDGARQGLDRSPSWYREEPQMDNIARSELRPDLHPERNFTGRGPKGWKRSDKRIFEEVCLALERSHDIDASELEIEVEEACVYMKGRLPFKGMRTMAEDLVGSVPGVEDVFTQIRIERKESSR